MSKLRGRRPRAERGSWRGPSWGGGMGMVWLRPESHRDSGRSPDRICRPTCISDAQQKAQKTRLVAAKVVLFSFLDSSHFFCSANLGFLGLLPPPPATLMSLSYLLNCWRHKYWMTRFNHRSTETETDKLDWIGLSRV